MWFSIAGSAQNLAEKLKGIRKDVVEGVLQIDGIDREDYISTMIDKPLAAVDGNLNASLEDISKLEDAAKALASDILDGVVTCESPEFTAEEYVQTVLGGFVSVAKASMAP